MKAALDDFERFLHEDELPALIHVGLAHAQFETIHPFLDGNGRVGRLLITFLLVSPRGAAPAAAVPEPLPQAAPRRVLRPPHGGPRTRATGRAGCGSSSPGWRRPPTRQPTARRSSTTREHRQRVQERRLGLNGMRLLDLLFERPLVNVNLVKDSLDVSFVTANKLVDQLESLGVVERSPGESAIGSSATHPMSRSSRTSHPASRKETFRRRRPISARDPPRAQSCPQMPIACVHRCVHGDVKNAICR